LGLWTSSLSSEISSHSFHNISILFISEIKIRKGESWRRQTGRFLSFAFVVWGCYQTGYEFRLFFFLVIYFILNYFFSVFDVLIKKYLKIKNLLFDVFTKQKHTLKINSWHAVKSIFISICSSIRFDSLLKAATPLVWGRD